MSQQFVDVPGKTIRWAGNRISPPPDVPECGFDGSKCTDGKYFFVCLFQINCAAEFKNDFSFVKMSVKHIIIERNFINIFRGIIFFSVAE